MHQGHNITWVLIEKNFKFTYDDKRFTPPLTGVISKDLPGAAADTKHFINKFVAAIKEFSETERKKYPTKIPPLSSDEKVFSDEILHRHPEYLTEQMQHISYWIKSTSGPYLSGDLMDAVNVLLYENEMSTLIMLAQHPKINMAKLHYHSWGHHFGFCRSRETALEAYMYFNTMEAVGALMNGAYTRTASYRHLLSNISSSMDFPGHQVGHKEFLRSCGMLNKPWEETLVHLDYEKLQEYLKLQFAILYRYDVLAKEAGILTEWERELEWERPFRRSRY